jgi:uncharacterized protein YbaR (Trm112 family)
MSAAKTGGEVDQRLLTMLVCPLTRGPLSYLAAEGLLVSEAAGLAYPVRDGVPVMLVDEAIPWPVPGSDVPASDVPGSEVPGSDALAAEQRGKLA